MSVYSRMEKLRIDPSVGEKLEIVFAAALNLEKEEEILEFAKEYKLMHPTDYKYDIQYVLSFYSMDDRKLWNKALNGFIYIDVLFHRSETMLYREVEYVNRKYKSLAKYNEYTNEEKGQHQNILSVGPHKSL